jgi:uncharacterized protein involved in outer membrane biogenesis
MSLMPNFLFLRRPLLVRTLLGLGALLLLYTLAGFVAVPALIEWQAERMAPEKLGRQLAVGSVEFNPYSLVLTVRDAKLMEPEGGARFASFDALTIDLSPQSLLRLAPVAQQVRLTKPYVRLVRGKDQRFNVDDMVARFAGQPPSPEPARFSLNNIQVEDGRIEFQDQAAGTAHTVADLKLGVPFISSLPADVDIFVEPLLSARVDDTPLLVKGRARPFADAKEAVVDLKLDALDLTRYLEYLPLPAQVKVPGARLDVDLQASFRQPHGQAPHLSLTGSAALKALRILGADGKPLLGFKELALVLRDAQVSGGRFRIASLKLDGLTADLVRGPDGQLNLQRLLGAAQAAPGKQPAGEAKAAKKAGAFDLALDRVEIRDATVAYADRQAALPLQASVEKFDLDLRRVTLDTGRRAVRVDEASSAGASLLLSRGALKGTGEPTAKEARAAQEAVVQPAPARPKASGQADDAYLVEVGRVALENWTARVEDQGHQEPVVAQVGPLSLALRDVSSAPGARVQLELKTALNRSGRLELKGAIGLAPLHGDLEASLDKVDLLPLQPYVTERINLQLTKASLSGSGRLRLDQDSAGDLTGGFKGNMALAEVAAQDKASGNDFMRWKTLSLAGIDLRLAPLALAVDDVALSDFFARLIIDASGRINVQDIVRTQGKPAARHPGDRAVPGQAVAAAAPPRPAPAANMPPVSIKKLSFQGGRVRFTDNFIKPNYSASLSDFGGVVSGLSSDPASSASVNLHGAVNRAPLTVAGRINPLRGDLFLDLKASVKGMELAALSAYSGRYVGYGIEKGKLSFEVNYRVEDRKLTAANRLLLDQLTFGQKVDSPSAMNLPVQLAVALLQDRNGVIDIDVPIGGSLDDPQFSLGGVILKVIGNAIAKAITQPFAMLGSLFGGGAQDLGVLAFEPGRFAIAAGAEERLRTLARALSERPGLKLEITGWADPQTDREGLKRAAIERKLRALKAKESGARGAAVSAAEYPTLLAQAYREEKFPKPRNLLGLAKNLPVPEMEKLMMDHIDIDDDDLAALGNRRAQAVKDWLQESGQVDAARLFILASRTAAEGSAREGADRPPNRVEFSLR